MSVTCGHADIAHSDVRVGRNQVSDPIGPLLGDTRFLDRAGISMASATSLVSAELGARAPEGVARFRV